MAVVLEGLLHVQEIFCEVFLEENEVIKDNFDFLCCSNQSEDCLLFLSKKTMFLTAYDSNVNRPQMKTGLCPLFVFFINVVAKTLRRLSKQNIEADK